MSARNSNVENEKVGYKIFVPFLLLLSNTRPKSMSNDVFNGGTRNEIGSVQFFSQKSADVLSNFEVEFAKFMFFL